MDAILANYSDFQVKTINSFMSEHIQGLGHRFRLQSGLRDRHGQCGPHGVRLRSFPPRMVREGTEESRFMNDIIDAMLANRGGDAPYPWAPAGEILGEIEGIYRKLAAYVENP